MEGLRYHSAVPEAEKSVYLSGDTIDILLIADGRLLVKNSVRLEGVLDVYSDSGTTRPAAGGIYFDSKIGSHAFIETLAVTTQEQGLIENCQNYARYVAMVGIASKSESDYLQSSQICELKSPHIQYSEQICNGFKAAGTNKPVSGFDFSMKPECALNKMSGDHLPFRKTGAIRLSINLARDLAALYGGNLVATSHYEIKDLRLSYYTIPDPGGGTTSQMRTVTNIKSNIQSALANISSKVPAIADSVSISFQRQALENSLFENNCLN